MALAGDAHRSRIIGPAGGGDENTEAAALAGNSPLPNLWRRIREFGRADHDPSARHVEIDAVGIIGVRLALRLATSAEPANAERFHALTLSDAWSVFKPSCFCFLLRALAGAALAIPSHAQRGNVEMFCGFDNVHV